MAKHKKLLSLSKEFQSMLGLEECPSDVRIQEDGLKAHIIKRGHQSVLPYFNRLEEILSHPDYIGVNPREKGKSAEFIKVFDKNVLVAIKLHKNGDFFYIPTMYEIQEYKLQSRYQNGRLKKIDNEGKK
ncbi:PBECR2 nuclease fold domain-containing protein [Streptococcus sp. ZJ93]|uniref:PBECR3 domain-containing polyvalent protein n=1 Tax=Streptococcus handemini TaxID=3161188 RepID=UPI0034D6D415